MDFKTTGGVAPLIQDPLVHECMVRVARHYQIVCAILAEPSGRRRNADARKLCVIVGGSATDRARFRLSGHRFDVFVIGREALFEELREVRRPHMNALLANGQSVFGDGDCSAEAIRLAKEGLAAITRSAASGFRAECQPYDLLRTCMELRGSDKVAASLVAQNLIFCCVEIFLLNRGIPAHELETAMMDPLCADFPDALRRVLEISLISLCEDAGALESMVHALVGRETREEESWYVPKLARAPLGAGRPVRALRAENHPASAVIKSYEATLRAMRS